MGIIKLDFLQLSAISGTGNLAEKMPERAAYREIFTTCTGENHPEFQWAKEVTGRSEKN